MPTPFNDQWRLPRWQDSRHSYEHTALNLTRERAEPLRDQEDPVWHAPSDGVVADFRKGINANSVTSRTRRKLP